MKKKPETNEDYLDVLKDIDSLYKTEGGKRLCEALVTDVVGKVNLISTQYPSLPHTELIAHCASIGEKLSIIHTLTRSEEAKKEIEKEIAEALRE